MFESNLIGRDEAMKRLIALLERPVSEAGDLRIMSVEGPGGVGKSALVRCALKEVVAERKGYLQLTVDRNFKRQGTSRTLHGIVGELIISATGGSLSQKPPGHYFPETSEAVRTMEAIHSEVLAELKQKGISPATIAKGNQALKGIIGLVDAVSTVVPKVKEYVNTEGLKQGAGKIDEHVDDIAALATESLSVFDRLNLSSSTARRNLAKTDPSKLFSQALVADLKPLLIGKHEKRMVPGHGKMTGTTRLLIVLEDYESLAPLIQHFLLNAFLKQVRMSGIDATLLILGRDRLVATDPTWKKDFTLEDPIVVKVLTQDETAEFLRAKGLTDEHAHRRAWQETFGLPFLLETWVREEAQGGRSALSVKEFYDRIKIWMSPQQEEWMKICAFLTRVDGNILSRIIDDKDNALAAFEWFKSEASIRDPNAYPYTMIPIVREMVRSYYNLEGLDLGAYAATLRTKISEMQDVVIG
jgi:hypothetical protein